MTLNTIEVFQSYSEISEDAPGTLKIIKDLSDTSRISKCIKRTIRTQEIKYYNEHNDF